MIRLTCPICKKEYEKSAGHYNRAVKLGAPVYCGKECAGIARRDNKTIEQKKAEKAAYDKKYIKKPEVKIKRKAYNETPNGRAMQKRQRAKKKEYHNEYCRQSDYVKWKAGYDQKHVNEKKYGEYAECAILVQKINKLLTAKADKQELRTIQGTNNKSKRRKKQWLRLLKTLPQLT